LKEKQGFFEIICCFKARQSHFQKSKKEYMANTLVIAFGCFIAQCSLTVFVGCGNTHNHKPSAQNTQPLPAKQEMPANLNDHEPIPLPRLIGMADRILFGMVQSVEKETFTFKVEEALAGESGKEAISIAQFVPNEFDGPRAAPYRQGQQFLVFLKMDATQNLLRILGAGGEGEMPVESGFVYFSGRHVEGLERKNYTVHQKERAIQRFDYKIFEEAVKDFRKCYRCEFDPSENRYKCQKTCEAATFQRLGEKSFIHKYLVNNSN
jgi:hypothetical protein